MLRFLLVYAMTAVRLYGETLLSGAIYFDSENTLIEVKDFIKSGDTNGLAMLFKGNHISEKVPQDTDIVVLVSGPEPESKTEFHFTSNPTTYWTYKRYVKTGTVTSVPVPSPLAALWLPSVFNSTLPPNLPSSLVPISDPPAAPVPTRLSALTLSALTPSPTPGHTFSAHFLSHHHYRHHRKKGPEKKPSAWDSFWQNLKKFFGGQGNA